VTQNLDETQTLDDDVATNLFDRSGTIRRILECCEALGNPKVHGAFVRLDDDKLIDILATLESDLAAGLRYDNAAAATKIVTPCGRPAAATPGRQRATTTGAGTASAGKHGRAIKTGEGYFAKLPVDAAVDPNLSHTDFRLLALLTVLAGDKGYCWWSEDKLAEELPGPAGRKGVSRSTITRGVAALARAGYIAIVLPEDLRRHGLTHATPGNTYVLTSKMR
jgi:hypothetical protein